MSFPPNDKYAKFVNWVSEDIIRQAFNSGQYWEKTVSGELLAEIKKNDHPAFPLASKEPLCTRSQYIVYRTSSGEFVAGVHQYLRPDDTLGGKGKPDPKRLVIGDRTLAVRAKAQIKDI